MRGEKVCIIGEVLIDFIATETETPLTECATFERRVGGSCANVARFLSTLGVTTDFASSVGRDGLGDYLISHLAAVGVNTDRITVRIDGPTSIVVVNKTSSTPDFVVHLGAHTLTRRDELPVDWLDGAALLHTNGFSLAHQPLRDTIVGLVKEAHAKGIPVSFDPNWREVVWPDRQEATRVIQTLSSHATWMKPSLDDARELLGDGTPEELALAYRSWGARNVVLTMGSRGALVIGEGERSFVKASGRLTCATGAGDAFWSLFLQATLDGATPSAAAQQAAERIVAFLERHSS